MSVNKFEIKFYQAVFGIITIIILCLFFVASYNSIFKEEENHLKLLSPDFVGLKQAPLFELNDFNGHRVSLNNYKGKTVILNFWTIDCEPCKEEIPQLNKLSKWEDALNFKLITVSVDQKQRLESFMSNYKELFVLMDPESEVVTRKYGTEKFPETWIINPEGYVVCRFDGPRNWLDSVFLSYIANLSKSKNYW